VAHHLSGPREQKSGELGVKSRETRGHEVAGRSGPSIGEDAYQRIPRSQGRNIGVSGGKKLLQLKVAIRDIPIGGATTRGKALVVG
jgi:hypothetical protein